MGASVYKFTAGVVDSTASNIKYLNRVSSEFTTASNISNLIKIQVWRALRIGIQERGTAAIHPPMNLQMKINT